MKDEERGGEWESGDIQSKFKRSEMKFPFSLTRDEILKLVSRHEPIGNPKDKP